MFKKVNDITYSFNINGKNIGVDALDNGYIEIYEEKDPLHTGFIVENTKHFVSLVNNLVDIAEVLLEEEK